MQVEQVFLDHGFQLDARSYATPRKAERQGFQKHLSIFTRSDLKIGADHMQLLATNAHDGSAAFGLDAGVFRAICANGLVSGDASTSIRIRHTGDVQSKLDEAIRHLLERMPQVAASVEAMQNTVLTPDEIRHLTRLAVIARTGKTPEHVYDVQAKRLGDKGCELWKVFNRIQEKAVGGGLQYLLKGEFKRSRKITQIARTVKLNKELWSNAMALVA
jgi:hypothetical protein